MNCEEREAMLIEDNKRREDEAAAFIAQELEAILKSAQDQLDSGVYFGNEPGETSGGWSLVSPSAYSQIVFDNPCGYWCSEWMDITVNLQENNHPADQLDLTIYHNYDRDMYVFDDREELVSNDEATVAFLEAHTEVTDLVLKIAKIVHDHSIAHPEEKD